MECYWQEGQDLEPRNMRNTWEEEGGEGAEKETRDREYISKKSKYCEMLMEKFIDTKKYLQLIREE